MNKSHKFALNLKFSSNKARININVPVRKSRVVRLFVCASSRVLRRRVFESKISPRIGSSTKTSRGPTVVDRLAHTLITILLLLLLLLLFFQKSEQTHQSIVEDRKYLVQVGRDSLLCFSLLIRLTRETKQHDENTKHETQAAIVRIMKMRQKMTHGALMSEVRESVLSCCCCCCYFVVVVVNNDLMQVVSQLSARFKPKIAVS